MGDEYEYDVDDTYDFDDGWMYVEDEYGLADEVAESQVPEPGYAGTGYELEMESYDYDLYGYWDDLEYADDAYWDSNGRAPSSRVPAEAVGQKRKRGAPDKSAAVDKRRKVSATQCATLDETEMGVGMETVVFRTQSERYRLVTAPPAVLKGGLSYALFPDWRERFTGKDGLVHISSMPADMRKAAEAKEEDTSPKARHMNASAMLEDGDEEEWEDDNAADEEGAGGLAALDPEMLKTVLKQKLGGAGLDGMDEEAFMATISKMLSGESVDDDATGDLANMLLGKATANSRVSGFLSQQGVSLEDAEDDEREQDSAISGLDVSPVAGKTTEMAFHPGSPIGTSKKLRKPPKKVQFDVPNADMPEGDAVDDEEEERLPTPPPSEDQQDAEADLKISAARATRTKAANTSAAKGNRATSHAQDLTAGPDAQLEHELESQAGPDDTAQIAAEGYTSKQTRKRKAVHEDSIGGSGELGGTEGRAVKEPATRRTRNARAKAGK